MRVSISLCDCLDGRALRSNLLSWCIVSSLRFYPLGMNSFSAPSLHLSSLCLAVSLRFCLPPSLPSTLSLPFSFGSGFHGDAIYCHIKCRGHCAHVHVCLSHQNILSETLKSIMKIPFIAPHRNIWTIAICLIDNKVIMYKDLQLISSTVEMLTLSTALDFLLGKT